MATLLQGLGQSQAISGYLQGISALRQQALQEKQGEQALQMNDINLAKSKLDLAEAQKKEQFMNQTSDPNMSPAFSWMTPEQKQGWVGKLEAAGFARKVGNTGSYVMTNRDWQNATEMFSSNAKLVEQFASEKIANTKNEVMGLQEELSKAQENNKGKPEDIQKIQQKLNDKLQGLNLLLGHFEPAIETAKFNESLNNFQQSNSEQYKTLTENPNFSMMLNFARNGNEKARDAVYKMFEETAKPKTEFGTFMSSPEGRKAVTDYKEAGKIPYIIGRHYKFTGQDGKTYEGTFKGLDDNNEPKWDNIVKVAEKPNAELMLEERAKNLGQKLVDGMIAPSQLTWRDRGAALSAAVELDPNYNAIEADANYKWYSNPSTQRLIRRTESIVDPKGAIAESIRLAQKVDNPAGTPINKVKGKIFVALGNSKRQLLDLTTNVTAEEMQQIFGSAQGGEKFLTLAQSLNDPNLSVSQYINAMKEIQYLIYTRQKANVRGTPLQKKWEEFGKQYETQTPYSDKQESNSKFDRLSNDELLKELSK